MWIVGALIACVLIGVIGAGIVALVLAPRRARQRLRARARIRLDTSGPAAGALAPGEPIAVEVQVAENDDPPWAMLVPTVVAIATGAITGLLAPYAVVGSVVVGLVATAVTYLVGFFGYARGTRGPSGQRWYAEAVEDHTVAHERRIRRDAAGNDEGPRPA